MARIDIRSTDHQVSTDKLLKAALRLIVKEINALRVRAGLSPYTAQEIKDKLRQELSQ